MMSLLPFGPPKGIEGRIQVSIAFCERLLLGIENVASTSEVSPNA